MPGTESSHRSIAWCFGCNVETRHQPVDLPPASDGTPRRSYVCIDCGGVAATTIELSEVEYNRLRAAERHLDEARRSLRNVVNAVLAGEELPAPFRRTEPTALN